MNAIAFAGCSYVAGYGLNPKNHSDSKSSPYLWVNLCHQKILQFKKLELINISYEGSSNTEIFEQAVEIISKNKNLKYLICCWTSMPRYSFRAGFELYDTTISMENKQRIHHLNDTIISEKYLQDLVDRINTLHHLQHEIVKLIKYTNILTNLTKEKQIKFFNVNSLCPWDNKFFIQKDLENLLPSDLTKFTQKEILNVDTRSDQEIIALYQLQHQMYNDVGGIQSKNWINLYNSYHNMCVDVNYDKLHPGIKSNQIFSDFFTREITKKIN
jgi:hypothetical protein